MKVKNSLSLTEDSKADSIQELSGDGKADCSPWTVLNKNPSRSAVARTVPLLDPWCFLQNCPLTDSAPWLSIRTCPCWIGVEPMSLSETISLQCSLHLLERSWIQSALPSSVSESEFFQHRQTCSPTGFPVPAHGGAIPPAVPESKSLRADLTPLCYPQAIHQLTPPHYSDRSPGSHPRCNSFSLHIYSTRKPFGCRWKSIQLVAVPLSATSAPSEQSCPVETQCLLHMESYPHWQKVHTVEIHLNFFFYWTQYIPNMIISTCNQWKIIIQTSHFFFPCSLLNTEDFNLQYINVLGATCQTPHVPSGFHIGRCRSICFYSTVCSFNCLKNPWAQPNIVPNP